jgi:hypothetical protein
MTVLRRLFPRQFDNGYHGHRAALWLFGLLVALKLVVSVNSILNTASVAAGADGIPLGSFGPAAARTVLMLFALSALADLALAVIAVVALIRYRAMVPFIYLILLGEYVAGRFIIQSYAVARSGGISVGWYVNIGIVTLMTLGLALSLIRARQQPSPHVPD